MHRLFGLLHGDIIPPNRTLRTGRDWLRYAASQLPAYLAGILYAVNPFVYDRFMAGQYAVLLGYAALPWFTHAWFRLVRQPGWRSVWPAAAWLAAIGILSIHTLVPAVFLAVGLTVWRLWRLHHAKPAHGQQWHMLRYAVLTAGVWLVASSYWLMPLLLGKGATARTIDSFTAGDRTAFATVGASFAERLGNVLGLQGFWAEARHLYTLPQQYTPGWLWVMLALLFLVAGGLVWLWRQGRRGLCACLIACTGTGALLATGLGSGWLAAHLPLFAGYREPQKFAVLVAFAYSIAAGFGAAAGTAWLRRHSRLPVTAPAAWLVVLALPFLSASALMWGTRGQLFATGYPAGWYQANQLLNRQPADGDNLFLPWHLYMYADFADRTIANPAASFFDRHTVISDDPELGGAAKAKPNATTAAISRLLADPAIRHDRTRFGRELAQLNIRYIVLARTSDYFAYAFLDRQSNITPIAKYDTLWVYRNYAYHAPTPTD